MLASILIGAIALALVPTPAQQEAGASPASIAGSGSLDFAALLERRDPAEVRAWFERHETLAFHRPKALLHALIDARRRGDAAAEAYADDARFLLAALGGQKPTSLIDTIVGWSVLDCTTFADLERDLVELSIAVPLPTAERIDELRAASEELGATALLSDNWGALVQPLHGANRLDEADDLARWVGEVALEVGDVWKLAWSVEWQGQIAWQRGDLRTAAALLERAVELDLLLGDLAYRTRLLCNLASVHLGLSDLAGALAYAERAEALARTLDDAGPLRLALEVKAGLHFDLGEHQTALEICTSLIPADPADDPRDLTQLQIYLTAADVLSDVGRVESALTYARRAHEISLDSGIVAAAPHAHLAVLLTLGLVLGDSGQTDEALTLLERAHTGFEQASDPLGMAWADKNRGWVLLGSGDLHGAIASFQAARATGARLQLPYLEGLTALGVAEALVGARARTEQQDAALTDAIETAAARAAELSDLQLGWRIAAVRGRIQLQAGELERAYQHFDRAVELVERWRRRLQAPGLLTHSLRNKSDPYREAAFVAARLGWAEDALRMVELLRARVLIEARTRQHGPLAGGDTTPLRPIRRRIAQAECALRNAGADAPLLTRERAALAAAEAQLDGALLVAELGRGGERTGSTSSARPLSATEISARIAAADIDQALSFLPGAEATLALIADDHTLAVVLLPIGERELSHEIARLRDPIEALRRGETDLAHLDFDVAAARSLHDALLASLTEAGITLQPRIAILADSVLSALPFELLVTGGQAGPVDPLRPFAHLRGLTFLAEQHRITYSSSLASLTAVKPRALPAGEELIALVAPPELGVASAEAEIDALRRALGAGLRLVAKATPASMSRPDVAAARRLHLLAHGEADPAFPAHGHLLLGRSPGAGAATSDDGGERLEAWQIEELNLTAELTVLSACHTGEGAWYSGEGLLGLTRSFLAAGSRQVIASRWAVEDEASALMMALLYDALARGSTPADALQEARLALLARDDERGFALAHPYFWAAWVLHH